MLEITSSLSRLSIRSSTALIQVFVFGFSGMIICLGSQLRRAFLSKLGVIYRVLIGREAAEEERLEQKREGQIWKLQPWLLHLEKEEFDSGIWKSGFENTRIRVLV